MTITTNQDLDPWPVFADALDDMPQNRRGFLARGPFARPDEKGDRQLRVRLKDQDRLKAVAAVVCIEQGVVTLSQI